MPVLKGTIEISRPVAEVFTYVTEPKNTQEWERGAEQELTSEGPIGLGSKGAPSGDLYGEGRVGLGGHGVDA